ncbi:MAG: hypothetical protein ACLRSJ_07375, partial [Agathobaculum sp.]
RESVMASAYHKTRREATAKSHKFSRRKPPGSACAVKNRRIGAGWIKHTKTSSQAGQKGV